MNHRIRLGPAAVFLAVAAVVITMLALLTISTSGADEVMAERFASVTKTRYELEAEGERFLIEAADAGIAGRDPLSIDGTQIAEDGLVYTSELDGYSLRIEISMPDRSGSYTIISRSISRIWNADDPMQNLWQGSGQ